MRYNRVVRYILLRIKKKWLGKWMHNKILDYLYPDDCVMTFEEKK